MPAERRLRSSCWTRAATDGNAARPPPDRKALPAAPALHRVAALVPAYDCARTIAEVVRGAAAKCERVLVVDDGSSDDTAEIARAAGADGDPSRGQPRQGGRAAQRARPAARRGLHARVLGRRRRPAPRRRDGAACSPSRVPIRRRSCSVRAASPPEQEVAPIKRFGNEFANWWVSLAAGREFRDTQTGFRIYPIAATLELGVQAERYQFESEVLILAARRGVDIRTCEVAVYYPPPGERISHYDPWTDTCRIIVTVVRSWSACAAARHAGAPCTRGAAERGAQRPGRGGCGSPRGGGAAPLAISTASWSSPARRRLP